MTVTYTSGQRISLDQIATDLKISKEKLHISVVRMEENGSVKLDGDDMEFLEEVTSGDISNDILSADERRDFERLDSAFCKKHREAIKALREIRERKLYRENFPTFDAYMASKGHTRQWATQQINWLRRQELLEEKAGVVFGKSPYQLTVAEAQYLGALEPDYKDCDHKLYAEMFVDAVIEAQKEAEAKKKRRTAKMLESAVVKRQNFIENRKAIGNDLTMEESVQIDRLNGKSHNELKKVLADARNTAQKENRSSDDCLKEKVEQIVVKEQKEPVQKNQNDNLQPDRNKQKVERKQKPKQNSAQAEAEIPKDEKDEIDDSEETAVFYNVQRSGDCASLIDTSDRLEAYDVTELLSEIAELVAEGSFKDGGIHLARCDDEETA